MLSCAAAEGKTANELEGSSKAPHDPTAWLHRNVGNIVRVADEEPWIGLIRDFDDRERRLYLDTPFGIRTCATWPMPDAPGIGSTTDAERALFEESMKRAKPGQWPTR